MSDISPYGTTEHPSEGAMIANALVGERAGSATGNASVQGAGPASFSTAPYKPPVKHPGPRGCWANRGTCGAPAIRGTNLCFFHSQEGTQ